MLAGKAPGLHPWFSFAVLVCQDNMASHTAALSLPEFLSQRGYNVARRLF